MTHFATNGAGSIHDFEFSLIGHTCESVAKYVSEGQFGLWKETGMLNDILKEGVEDGLGAGEAIGRYIWENNLPYREYSVLANGYHLHVPCTVHIGIGNDILHEHPNVDGRALGEASYRGLPHLCPDGHRPGGRRVPELRLCGHRPGGLPQGPGHGTECGPPRREKDRPLYHGRCSICRICRKKATT